VANDVIVEITENVKFLLVTFLFLTAFLYSSTQEIADKLVKFIVNSTSPKIFFEKGIKLEYLSLGKMGNRNDSVACNC